MPVISELLARLGVDSRDFEKKLHDAEQKLKRQAGVVDGISRKLAAGVAAIVGGIGIKSVLSAADAYTVLQNRLRAVTKDQAELARIQQQLFAISRETRSSVEANVELFSRLSLSTKELGVSQSEVLTFTRSLNQAIKLSGATATEAQAGIIQLAQGMASGALRGDELRSVLEQLPAVADVIAKGLGVTRGQLRELGSDGKITAGVILSAFREARGELEERFGRTVPTLAEGFQVLKDSLVELAGEMVKITGLGDSLGGVLTSIASGARNLATAIRDQLKPAIQILREVSAEARGGLEARPTGTFVDPFTGRPGTSSVVPPEGLEFETPQPTAFVGPMLPLTGGFIGDLSNAFSELQQKSSETFTAMSEAGISFLLNAGTPIEEFLTSKTPENLSTFQEAWLTSFQNVADTTTAVTEIASNALHGFFQGFAQSLVQAITQTAEFGEAFLNIFINVLGSLLQSLVAFVLEVVALRISQIIFNVAAAESKSGIGGVIAAIIAIPILIGALIALSAAQRKRSKEIVGMDTGGLVTAQGLALLHPGEVVATPDEVTDAMRGGGGLDFTLAIDGRTVARAILPHIPRELRMRGI